MSTLPKGWTHTPLGNLLIRIEAGLNVKCEERPPVMGERGLVKISAVTWGRFDELQSKTLPSLERPDPNRKIQVGDLLLSRANTLELVGASVIVGELYRDLYLSDKVLRLVVHAPSKRWINYALKTPAIRKAIGEASSGNQLSMRNISQDSLRQLQLPLAPEPEQKRIADKLDTVLARVDAVNTRLARVAPLLKRFRQSVLAAATSGRLTEDWRAAHGTTADNLACISSIQQAKHAWLKENSSHNEAGRIAKRIASFANRSISDNGLPRSWCWTALEDAVLMVVDCHNKTAPYVANGIPLVRTTNVRDGAFAWEDLRFVDEETHQFWSKRCVPTSGDIVFTREAPMGEAAIIPADMQICLGQRTMLIRPVGEAISGQYLLIALLDPAFKMRAGEVAVGTGVKHLRVGDVSELKLPLPPIDEQTEIVRRVETLFAFADRLEARLHAAQTAADRLTPSLLAKAFRGELVPQDPNDESASELLKRLAASATSSAPKRGRAKVGKAA